MSLCYCYNRERKRRDKEHNPDQAQEPKRTTRKDTMSHESKKEYWRQQKQEQRRNWTAQKWRRHREVCSQRYHKKKENHTPIGPSEAVPKGNGFDKRNCSITKPSTADDQWQFSCPFSIKSSSRFMTILSLSFSTSIMK